MSFPRGPVVKNLLANAGDAGDMGLIPRSERSPGGGNGNPLQYYCLENSMDRGVWQAIQSMGSQTIEHYCTNTTAHYSYSAISAHMLYAVVTEVVMGITQMSKIIYNLQL